MEEKCVENYHDGCKHREIIDTPFSADWCCLKKTYCDNVKPKENNVPKKIIKQY